MNPDANDAIFPTKGIGHVEEPEGCGHENLRFTLSGGMSLRDYFAAHAIVTVASRAYANGIEVGAATYAEAAYLVADAMLAERAKGDKS